MSDETCCGACGYPVHATKEMACDWCRQAADRIEALTEQLAAARQDAKFAEDELELQEQEACMMENDYLKLKKERDALQSALGRIRSVPERILRGVPVCDLAETLAEADSALNKGGEP